MDYVYNVASATVELFQYAGFGSAILHYVGLPPRGVAVHWSIRLSMWVAPPSRSEFKIYDVTVTVWQADDGISV
ncbi:hypothetical protein GCM10009000_091810 [Halobacterium noricense]|uniref:Uncharacterized protein n=1 Tax=Haladaptatus pallidirubidus TaxID=1008152 RepID=A0AAV3UI90_9EURY